MNILAIDPGYDRCGWAIVDSAIQSTPIQYGCIVTQKTDSFFVRLTQVLQALQHIIQQHNPKELAIESLFFSNNQKTAMRVAEVRGAITGLCLVNAINIFEYSPVEVKQAATGNGKADKKAVEKMVRMQLKISPNEKLIDDTLDALAIGLTHQVCRKVLDRNIK